MGSRDKGDRAGTSTAVVVGKPPTTRVPARRSRSPDGFDTDYAGLTAYFTAVRAAFDDRSIRRGVRFDEQGRLVEEHVRTDYRSFLRQLGAAEA